MATPQLNPREAGEPWATYGFFKTPGIPAPTGKHNVGCVDIMTESGLLALVFYPTNAQHSDGYQYRESLPDPKYSRAFCDIFNRRPAWLISFVFSKLTDARSPALVGAPFSATIDSKCPVIVFSHGLYSYRTIYSGMCCELASHGFIVAALEHKDQSACVTFKRVPGPGVAEGDYDNYINEWIPAIVRRPDTSPLRYDQVKQRASEVGQCLDMLISLNNGETVKNLMGGQFDLGQFTGHIDTDKAMVTGHSFGGATTIATLATDNRFKCGIALDPWIYPIQDDVLDAGIDQPLLLVACESWQWPKNIANLMRLVTPPDESGIAKCSLVTLKGTNHVTLCDSGYVVPNFMNKYFTPNMYEANAINSEMFMAFIKRHILKDPSYQGRVPLIDGGDGGHESVIYGTNVVWKPEDAHSDDPAQQTSISKL